MHRRVALVTDSTACLPPTLAQRLGIAVVPLQLRVGEHVDDESRIPVGDLVRALRDRVEVDTAPPDPGAFFWAYQDAWGQGADAVVSLHISARQSATYQAARDAAAHSRVPVHVVDTGTTGMSLGYSALSAASVAQAGGDVEQVLAAAQQRYQQGTELIYVDTLEYLRRGGRIGAAAALLGSALSMKPLLTMSEGQVAPLDRVMGAERAVRKLVDLAVRRAGNRPVDVAVEHFDAAERAVELVRQLRARIPSARQVMLTQVSSIIGAHVGPGALGITVSPI
jgi:DegV family protein with EDD domain